MKNIRRLSPLSVMFILFAFVFFLFISFHGATGNGVARSSGDLAQAVQNFKSHSTDKNNTISSDSGHQALVSGDGQTVTWYNQNGQEFQSPIGTSDQATQLFNNNGYYNYKNEASSNNSILLLLLTNFLPFLVMGLILWWVIRQARSGNNQAMSFGRSKHRLIAGDKPSVTFADVAGVEEAKVELNEIVEFLKYPDKFKNVGARIPKGVLMVGSPGTGKTLLSKAVAGEAGVPFFSISGSEFVEMFVGVGASVTGDTPVLVKTEEGVKLLPIREVVDSHYEKDSEGFPIKINGLQTLSYEGSHTGFRGKLGKINNSTWSNVNSVYRHKVEEIYEINYLGGTIKATGNHSVFVRGHGGIKSKAVSELKPGEVLVNLPYKTRLSFRPGHGTEHEVRGHKFTFNYPKTLTLEEANIEARTAYEYAIDNKGVLTQAQIAKQLGISQMTVCNWQSGKHNPRAISSKYIKTVIPQSVNTTPELMRLFGFYTAEGRSNGSLQFCFGTHEKETFIKECVDAMHTTFNLLPKIEEREDNSTVLTYFSAPLGRFFAAQCGNGSKSKHIPSMLWDMPKEYFLAYLDGYLKGDATCTPQGKWTATSVSEQLILELAWLSSMHGIKTGIGKGIHKAGRCISDSSKPLPETQYWRLTIGATSNPFSPTSEEHKKPVITSIEKLPYNDYVYDLCGCENEAFFGGKNPILLHNSRVRDLFEQAKKNSPCIVFVDEIDAVGRQRGAGLGGGHDEREQTLNQLLVEMDGFETNDFVIVIAATNRPDVLDPALLRPGRFDRQVVLDRPDIKGRRAILDVHSRNRPLESNVNLDVIAKQTPGFTGADLANLLNEAAIFAARANKKTIGMVELEEAIARVIAGPERKSRMISEREKRVIAYHEMGHALVINSLENTDPVHKITIVSRGMALGWTMSLPQEDKVLVSREELRDQMAGMLGGRCAEEIFLNGNITTGASDDIDKATNMARRMVVEWGMSEKLGPRKLGSGSHQVFLGKTFGEENKDYSEEVAGIIDEEIARLVTEAHDRARVILLEKQTTLKALAERLIEIETMDAEEMKRIIAACENGSYTPNLVVIGSTEEAAEPVAESSVNFPEPPPAPPTV